MNRQGTVTRIEGDLVGISTQPLVCCSGESACSCMNAGKFVEFKARNPQDLDLKVGDYVDVANSGAMNAVGLLRLLALPAVFTVLAEVFLVPLFADSTGAASVLAALGASALGFWLGSLVFKADRAEYPVVTKVIEVMDLKPFSVSQ